MTKKLHLLWAETDGVLAFEWTLLLTLLVIGIVSGVAAARDAIIDELGDTAQVMLAVDQSYTIAFPLAAEVHTSNSSSSSDTSFTDALIYLDCERTDASFGTAGGPGPVVGQNNGGGFAIPIDDVDS
jgi:Flp pilus assembly pilin Flp